MNSPTYVAILSFLLVDVILAGIKACFNSIIFSCSHQSVFLEGVLSNVCHTSFSVPILCSKLLPFRFARLRFLAIGPASMRGTSFFCCLRSLLFHLRDISWRILLDYVLFYAVIVIFSVISLSHQMLVSSGLKKAHNLLLEIMVLWITRTLHCCCCTHSI
jgi:hypothetical protein